MTVQGTLRGLYFLLKDFSHFAFRNVKVYEISKQSILPYSTADLRVLANKALAMSRINFQPAECADFQSKMD